jgi:hypothetical protein
MRASYRASVPRWEFGNQPEGADAARISWGLSAPQVTARHSDGVEVGTSLVPDPGIEDEIDRMPSTQRGGHGTAPKVPAAITIAARSLRQ